ncbi:unknown [Haloarcula marismortui ATCC 43049]|uniref:Uncharacterized protein n=1 Tax=Haloarcula marismortui (strain ATCC 43049 / DSM 3752 / JCM 8966 / VKM B-1809) TaxID=272569 RepID=Q5V563_HALMA|nr:unknown [Haloarcula marismortui ATCC 43049]
MASASVAREFSESGYLTGTTTCGIGGTYRAEV